MAHHILLPLDGSERSEAIIRYLRPFLVGRDAMVTLLGVIEDTSDASPPELLVQATRHASDYLRTIKEHLDHFGVQAHVQVHTGPAARTIVQCATDLGVELIALASHGHRGLDRIFYGSTAERILRTSHVPVLLVKSVGHRRADGPPPLDDALVQRILVPLDGSEQAEAALDRAVEVAVRNDAVIHAVRVLADTRRSAFFPPVDVGTLDAERQVSYLGAIVDRLAARSVSAEMAVLRGGVASAVQEYVREHEIDLVVMTTHGRSGLARLLLGSTAEELLRTLMVPILVRRVA